MPTWPASLPQAPEREGYSEQWIDPVLRAPMRRALADGALVACVSDLAPLRVLSSILECTVCRLLVDLRDALLASGDDQIDLGLLAAHQRTHDFLDEAR